MAGIIDLPKEQLKDFREVRDEFSKFKGYISLKTEDWLTSLFLTYDKAVLIATIDVCFQKEWKQPAEFELAAEIVKDFGAERVRKAVREVTNAKWHSPRALRAFLKGDMTPKAFRQEEGEVPIAALPDQRDKHIYSQPQGIRWLRDHDHDDAAFYDFFDNAGESEPVGKQRKPVRLYKLKGEYR